MLNNAKGLLTAAAGMVSRALDGEEDALDNMPESFADTERYEKLETAIGLLEGASDDIENAIDKIASAAK